DCSSPKSERPTCTCASKSGPDHSRSLLDHIAEQPFDVGVEEHLLLLRSQSRSTYLLGLQQWVTAGTVAREEDTLGADRVDRLPDQPRIGHGRGLEDDVRVAPGNTDLVPDLVVFSHVSEDYQ